MDELSQRFPLMVQKIMNHVDSETLINFKEAGRNNATFLGKERFYWIRIIKRYNCLFGEFQEVWKKVVRKTPVRIIKELAVAVHQFPQTMLKYLEYETFPGEPISPLDFALSIEKQWHPLFVGVACGSVNLCNNILQKTDTKKPRLLDQKLRFDKVAQCVFATAIIKDVNVVDFLLDNAEDINWCWILGEDLMINNFHRKLRSGKTPFNLAASNFHLDVSRFFIEKSVEKNQMSTLLIMEQLILIMKFKRESQK